MASTILGSKSGSGSSGLPPSRMIYRNGAAAVPT